MNGGAVPTLPNACLNSPNDAARAAWRSPRSASRSSRRCSIRATIRMQHPHISLATVHRTLETLCDIGEARKVTMLHDSARYDGNITPHHHVVCVKCRRIRDIEIPHLDRLLAGQSELGEFMVIGSTLEIHALCEECGAKRAKAKRTRKPRGRFQTN